MSVKDLTVPELLLLLAHMVANSPLNNQDRQNAVVLQQQRSFTRFEKQLITSLAKKYNTNIETVINSST